MFPSLSEKRKNELRAMVEQMTLDERAEAMYIAHLIEENGFAYTMELVSKRISVCRGQNQSRVLSDSEVEVLLSFVEEEDE